MISADSMIRRAGQLQDQPGRGDKGKLVTQDGGGRAGEEQAEVAQGHDLEHGILLVCCGIHKIPHVENHTSECRNRPVKQLTSSY
jgi:hypothetical protein